jgi:outer membrane autotransporter protein
MPTHNKYRPKHLALAIALSLGYVEIAQAQQAPPQAAADEKITKPRKKKPKPVTNDDDIFAIKEFIGPLEHSAPINAPPGEKQAPRLFTTNPNPVAAGLEEMSQEFADFFSEPAPTEPVTAPVKEDPFDKFRYAYTTDPQLLSTPLENIEGVSLQLGEADDLVVINKGARWDGRIDGGGGKNNLLLNAPTGGEIGETRNFEHTRIARGNWTLHHDFAGHAEVKAETSLLNNGSIKGDAVVDANAVYSGHGSVNNLHVDGALVVSPLLGSPLIKGNLTLSAGANFSYGLSVDEYSKPVVVGGTATLAGAGFHVSAISGAYRGSVVTPVLHAAKIEGKFAEPSSSLAYMTPKLSYAATAVTLTYERNALDLEDLANSTNGQALAHSINTTNAVTDNPAVRALLHSNKATAPHAIEQLAASNNANLAKATFSSVNPVSVSMLSAMRQLDHRSDSQQRSAQAPRVASGSKDNGRVWLQALGHGGKVDRDFDSTLKHATQGLVMGADWRVDELWHVGVIGGKSQTRLDARQFDGDLDSWHLGAYAARQDGPIALRLGASYASHDGSSKRQVAFNRFSDRPKGRYDAHTQQAFAEVGYNLARANISIEPFAGLGYQRYQRDSYTEKGSAASLKVYGETLDYMSSTFGLRLAKKNTLDNGMHLTPRLSASVKHIYGELNSETRQQLVMGGQRFEVEGAAMDRNSLTLDAGLDLSLSTRHTLSTGINAEFGTDSRNHGVIGQWRLAF